MAGYCVSWKVLDAKDYGLAQDRKRLIIVGIKSSLKKSYDFPAPTHGPGAKQKYKTLKDVIWNYKKAPKGTYDEEELHWYYLSRNRRREWGQQSGCVVAHWRHVGLHPDCPPLRKLGTDKWAFSKKGKVRRFSYLECAALQGFPNPYAFDCPEVQVKDRFRAIGNAVPPPLYSAVASKHTQTLKGRC